MNSDITGLEAVYQLFVDVGLGSDPDSGQKPWPMYIGILPDVEQGDSIAFFDIGIPTNGRLLNTGETIGHDGFQIRVTSRAYLAARKKIFEIIGVMDRVHNCVVPVENDQYTIFAIHRMRQPVFIGKDENDRDSFTVDCKTRIRKVEETS